MTTEALTRPRSTGQVVGSARASLLVVEGLWTWYRRNWRATVFSSVLQPVLFLLAMGLGLGSQIRSSQLIGGLSYLEYLAPALLAAAAVQTAAGESTYPILSAFKWQKTYWGITSTPISPHQVLSGQLLWISLRLFGSGAVYLVIAALFGAVRGPGIVLSLVVATLTGMAFCAPLVAYSASTKGEGQGFNAVFRFIVLPMTLFAGTFYPVSQLPAFLRPVAWVTPLWHGTELARAAAFGTLRLWPAAGHLAYLVALLTVGVLLARWRYRVRLAE